MRERPHVRDVRPMRTSILAALESTTLPHMWRESIAEAVDSGLSKVSPGACVMRGMAEPRAQRQLQRFNGDRSGRLFVLSVGKAAQGMHATLLRGLGTPPNDHRYTTLHADRATRVTEAILTEHPDPGLGSLELAAWARARCIDSRAGDLLIACVSGGASSMMCGWGSVHHDELRSLVAQLRARGATIEEVNAVRSAFDPLKSGGLRRGFEPGDTMTFVLSDTPFAAPSVVGSGPTIPSRVQCVDELLARYELVSPPAPPRFDVDSPRVSTDFGGPSSGPVHVVVEVGGNDTALEGIVESLLAHAPAVTRGPPIRGDAFEAGQQFARELKASSPGFLVAGGECTTTIGGEGRGGRTMEFALGAAQHIHGRPDVGVVALATDARDGNSNAAGAVTHGRTLDLLERVDHSVAVLMARSDSATGLRAINGIIESEPTDTNVADIVIGWHLP